MPRTAAQIEASRRNGAASRGPVTAAGKAISSHNAHRHGLCAAAVSLTRTEDPEELRALHAAVLARYRPVDMVEHALCAEISAALWQKRRARLLEAQLLDREAARLLPARSRERAMPPGIPDDWQPLPCLDTLIRYQARADQALRHAQRALAQLRAACRDEPAADRHGTNEPGRPDEPVAMPPAGQAVPPRDPSVPATPPGTNEPEPVAPFQARPVAGGRKDAPMGGAAAERPTLTNMPRPAAFRAGQGATMPGRAGIDQLD